MNFDVEHTAYAVLDRDNTTLSRQYLENFAGSRYFEQRAPIRDYAELERRIQSAEISVAIEIPPRFAADVQRGRAPEVGVWIDGAMPFHGETMRGQAQGVHEYALADYARRHGQAGGLSNPADLRFRYRYNQDFRSINAIAPSVIALLLIFFPSILMALGVVREKELGSITNMYATPVTRLEFMMGKHLPYIGIAMANFLVLTAMTVFVFGVPLKAGFLPLAAGALLYAISTMGIGLLLSAVTRTQVAAMMGTAIITLMPAVQFCGMITPVSSLTGSARVIGVLFPTTYFMKISVGAFTKAVDFSELGANYFALAGFIAALTFLNLALIKKAGHLKMRQRLVTIYRLGVKELRSLRHDTALVIILFYAFTFAIYTRATGAGSELHNAAIAIVDEDRSILSSRIRNAFLPPWFQPPAQIAITDIDSGMDSGRFTFVIDIPSNFERDVLRGRRPALQVNIDATAMLQAGSGARDISEIIPNLTDSWFVSVMEMISVVTMLTIASLDARSLASHPNGARITPMSDKTRSFEDVAVETTSGAEPKLR